MRIVPGTSRLRRARCRASIRGAHGAISLCHHYQLAVTAGPCLERLTLCLVAYATGSSPAGAHPVKHQPAAPDLFADTSRFQQHRGSSLRQGVLPPGPRHLSRVAQFCLAATSQGPANCPYCPHSLELTHHPPAWTDRGFAACPGVGCLCAAGSAIAHAWHRAAGNNRLSRPLVSEWAAEQNYTVPHSLEPVIHRPPPTTIASRARVVAKIHAAHPRHAQGQTDQNRHSIFWAHGLELSVPDSLELTRLTSSLQSHRRITCRRSRDRPPGPERALDIGVFVGIREPAREFGLETAPALDRARAGPVDKRPGPAPPEVRTGACPPRCRISADPQPTRLEAQNLALGATLSSGTANYLDRVSPIVSLRPLVVAGPGPCPPRRCHRRATSGIDLAVDTP